MSLNFKNRIAFHYMIATAVIMAIVFGAIFFIVKGTVLHNLDSDLSYEADKHSGEIKFIGDSILFINKEEWAEREHKEIQVNPVFIQLMDNYGRLTDKSPNLKQDTLSFKQSEFGGHFNSSITGRTIRQVQLPIERNGKISGYILVAMSSDSAFSVILKLRNVLIISFFIVLIGLYFISRFLAGRSILPVQKMTDTIARITKNNLKERVGLPPHNDEIYTLSASFNALLERIEKAIEREKQFTSDASHELRTPLATLRGTLEVLIRKPRTEEEYKDKIQYSLKEIDRMTVTLEQLLLLARLDTVSSQKESAWMPLSDIIEASIASFKAPMTDKNIHVSFTNDCANKALVPSFYSRIIIDNVLSNAIKYSHQDEEIKIGLIEHNNQIICSVEDRGIGIRQEDLGHIFEGFYRSDALNHKHIVGNGLGLSIAKKCADAMDTVLTMESELNRGTKVTIIFPFINRD